MSQAELRPSPARPFRSESGGATGFLWLCVVIIAGMLAGCGGQQVRVTTVTIPPEVRMFTYTVDAYIAQYQEEFSLRTRAGDTPQAIAEAYLRVYQPGPLPRVFETTYIYARNGELLAELADEGYRTWVPLDRISRHVLDAVVATEDATFFQNAGYDPRRIIGAMVQNMEAGDIVSGASTITMQLARHLFFTPEQRFDQNIDRKFYEALLAQDLTALYSKAEILEMYLNLVHFGRTAYGIEAAAQVYFGKRAAELSLAEATLLAGIPQQPGDYDLLRSVTDVKPRQRIVLDLMARHGYLSAAEADAVFATPIVTQSQAPVRGIRHAPHFVHYVVQALNVEMPGLDIRRTGMRIYTTLDLPMQELAQAIVAEQVAQLQPRFDLSNAALVALKPGTADILVMVGSADFNDVAISGQVNVATRQRQPGSAIKPMLYALALDDNLISPTTVLWDLEAVYRISDIETYRPRNYDNRFRGPVTAREALASSYNIPAVKLLDGVGVGRLLEGSRQMGIHSLTRDLNWYGLSLTLGGGEVTLLDLTSAFHTLANAGGYVPPLPVRFTGGAPEGRNILPQEPNPQFVISPEAAFLTTHIMQDNEARIPAFGANSPMYLSVPAAAKTGTTTDWRDNWTLGYTRYLVAGVWAGNSDGRPMRNVSGITGAAPIWQAFMEAVHSEPAMLGRLGVPHDAVADPQVWAFAPPPGVVELPIDCPAGLRCPATEYFSESWLAQMEDLGPQGDSMLRGSARTLYVDVGRGRRPVGVCRDDGAEIGRTLYRMPIGIGGNRPSAAPLDALAEMESVGQAATPNLQTHAQRIRLEQETVFRWSVSNGAPLHFGPCAGVELAVTLIFGSNAVASIGDFAGAVALAPVEPLAQTVSAAVAPPSAQAAAPRPPAPSSSRFEVMGVARDNSCGGVFVLGMVGNAQGAMLPGIRVVMTDSFGNRMETMTGSQPSGYGSFRIPVQQSELPQDIYISLYSPEGALVGGPAHVQHRQGGASDLPCHHVIWRGVD